MQEAEGTLWGKVSVSAYASLILSPSICCQTAISRRASNKKATSSCEAVIYGGQRSRLKKIFVGKSLIHQISSSLSSGKTISCFVNCSGQKQGNPADVCLCGNEENRSVTMWDWSYEYRQITLLTNPYDDNETNSVCMGVSCSSCMYIDLFLLVLYSMEKQYEQCWALLSLSDEQNMMQKNSFVLNLHSLQMPFSSTWK